MSKAIINYLGSIEDKNSGTSITGSKTIVDLKVGDLQTPRIIFDFGAVQGVKKAHEFNKNIEPSVINADYLVITHAHTDHSGMIPYLVKKGFSGKILMTELTKLQTIKMWEDTIRLTRREIKGMKEGNNKILEKLSKAFQLKKHIEIFKETSKKDKSTSEKYLIRMLGDKNIDDVYNESVAILKEYGVETQDDFYSVLRDVPELLFDEDDIKIALEKIQIVDTKNEIEIENFHPVTSAKEKIVDDLPKLVRDGRKKPLTIASYLKGTITSKYKALIKKIQKEQQENKSIEISNQELVESLTLAFNLVKFSEENGMKKSQFEKEFGELLLKDEDALLEEKNSLDNVILNGKSFNVDRLLRFYRTFSDKLGIKKENFEKLKNELGNLKINSLKDIGVHLPELPDHNFEVRDIRNIFKNAILIGDGVDINLKETCVFIDDIEKYSSEEILYFIKDGKKIFIAKKVENVLKEKLQKLVEDNNEKIRQTDKIKKELHDAFDVIEIFEGNDDLYLQKNAREYEDAKKYISNYKKTDLKKSLYEIEELENLVDIELEEIYKNKNIIHIKRLDDPRIYEVLFNNDNNTVYYFEPKIRQRIIQKLEVKLQELNKEERNNNLAFNKYQDSLHFINIYESKLLLSSYQDYELTYDEAKKLLTENNVSYLDDIENLEISRRDFYSNSEINKFVKNVAFIDSKNKVKEENSIFIESLDDERLYDFRKTKSKFFIKNSISTDELKQALINYRESSTTLQKSQKDKLELLKRKLLEAFSFVTTLDDLQKKGFSEESYKKARELLNRCGFDNRSQINLLNIGFSYTLKDIEALFEGAFINGNDFKKEDVEFIFIGDENDDRIYDLPYIYADKTKIVVIKEDLKERIKEKLKKGIGDFHRTRKIRKEKRKSLEEKLELYEFLVKNYKSFFDLDGYKDVQSFFEYLSSIGEKKSLLEENISKIRQAHKLKAKINEFGEEKLKELQNAKKLLEKYNINSLEDIPGILQDLYEHDISIEDIKKAIKLLSGVHIDKNGDILESIKLNFYSAGHIEGSIQALATFVVSEVNQALNGTKKGKIPTNTSNRRLKHVNVGFSGDLGRIKEPNLTGSPQNIPFALDYYQIETTYAGRIHPDKQKSIENLFYSITEAKGKIVIPAFSMQRTQELLMILLKARLDSQDYIEGLNAFNKEKKLIIEDIKIQENLKSKVIERDNLLRGIGLHEAELRILKNLTIPPKEYGKIVHTLDSKIKQKQSKIRKLKSLGSLENIKDIENKISELLVDLGKVDLQIAYIKPKIFDTDIILDSPLSEEITNIYINYCGEKYDLLNPETQKRLFGKEVIKYVKKRSDPLNEDEDRERNSLEEIYSDERRNKKEIIVSASGMCDGGSIEYHLKENLVNPNSKIIFIGYCPENTRGGKIKAENDFISFDGIPYELKCEVDDIEGFSAHMDEEEILMFLTGMKFKKGAMIALNHGGEARYELAKKIELEMEKTGQKINVVIPKPGEKIIVKI